MKDYREKVRRLSLEQSGEPFFNASEDHAAIIVENMFRVAEREVCIFTSHLAPRIYARDECVSWATIFLADDQEHTLRVVAKEGDVSLLADNPLFKAVKRSDKFELRAIPDAMADGIKARFMTADGDHYRFEPDKTKCEAVASFGSPVASELQQVFETLWTGSSPVDLDKLELLHPSLAVN